MTLAEHRFLVLALAWVLASIPMALLAWQVWWRPGPVHPVIPHEDALPAGSFLDVALPPPLPDIGERGIVQRHWRARDGWVALILVGVGVLTLLMGPLTIGPEQGSAPKLTPEGVGLMLAFQWGMGGLLLFYLKIGRGLSLTKVFGLNRQPALWVPVWAMAWLVPGLITVGILNWLYLPVFLKWLGQESASLQPMVSALLENPDPKIKWMVAVSAVLGAPFMEELVFRGFLYSVARRFTHWSYAALATSLLFGIVHGNAQSILPLTVLGLFFTAAYEHSKSILVPMVMHGSYNLLMVSLMFYFPELVKQLEKV